MCSVEFMTEKLRGFVKTGILDKNTHRIWCNPDCGLKTREWQQVLHAAMPVDSLMVCAQLI